jgi:hypothetical protein
MLPISVLQDLFKQLLSSRSWATGHACLEALLQLMRHGSLGTGIVRLLPADMLASDTAAKSEVVDAVKSHLQRRPYGQQVSRPEFPAAAVIHAHLMLT